MIFAITSENIEDVCTPLAWEGEQPIAISGHSCAYATESIIPRYLAYIDGKYNLAESIDEELRCGMFNPTWQTSYPPVFGDWLPKIPVSYVDSSKVAMVRAADVTANWAFMAERDKEAYP